MFTHGLHLVDLTQLRYAVAAAELGSLRRVAELLRVRHSIVSRSIRQLEHSLGVVVFERSGTGVKPTRAGRNVLRMARTVLQQVDVLVTTAKAIGKGEAGRLSVGFSTSISFGNLRAMLIEFRMRFPQVELVTVERSWTRLATSLENGAVDILIVTGEMLAIDGFSEKEVLPLWRERVFAAVPDDHPLAARDAISWIDLRGEMMLLSSYDPGREFENLLTSKLASAADRPRIARHDVSRGIIKSLISMKLGIGLVIESDIGANFAGLAYRELRDGSGPSCVEFSALWRADNENPVLNSFVKLLAERYPLPDDSI